MWSLTRNGGIRFQESPVLRQLARLVLASGSTMFRSGQTKRTPKLILGPFGLVEQANLEYRRVMDRKEKPRIRREEAQARDAEKLKEFSERLRKV